MFYHLRTGAQCDIIKSPHLCAIDVLVSVSENERKENI